MSWLLWGLGGICTQTQYDQRPGPDLSGRRARACQAKSNSAVGDRCAGAKYFALAGPPGTPVWSRTNRAGVPADCGSEEAHDPRGDVVHRSDDPDLPLGLELGQEGAPLANVLGRFQRLGSRDRIDELGV